MKKIIFILLSIFIVSKNSEAVTVNVTGNANPCPGSIESYHANFTGDGGLAGFTKVVWTCGGSGVFQATGTTTYTQYLDISAPGALRNTDASIIWGAGSGVSSWLSAQYTYTIISTFTVTGYAYVNLGIMGSPGVINAPASVCINNSNSYSVSCPTPLPMGASGYVWSVTNATIVGSGSSATVTCLSGNNNPIVVSVKYSSSCGHGTLYSAALTKTIARTTTAPTAYSTMTTVGSGTAEVEFHFHLAAGGTSLESSPDNVTWTNFGGLITLIEGHSQNIYVRSKNDCGAGPSKLFHMFAPSCPTCPRMLSIIPEKGDIAEQKKTDITVYPNPASEKLTIDINSAETAKYNITLFDMYGKKVAYLIKDVEVGSNTANFDATGLSNGIFFLYVDNGMAIQKNKVVITH